MIIRDQSLHIHRPHDKLLQFAAISLGLRTIPPLVPSTRVISF